VNTALKTDSKSLLIPHKLWFFVYFYRALPAPPIHAKVPKNIKKFAVIQGIKFYDRSKTIQINGL
jgi:hypothetical protein